MLPARVSCYFPLQHNAPPIPGHAEASPWFQGIFLIPMSKREFPNPPSTFFLSCIFFLFSCRKFAPTGFALGVSFLLLTDTKNYPPFWSSFCLVRKFPLEADFDWTRIPNPPEQDFLPSETKSARILFLITFSLPQLGRQETFQRAPDGSEFCCHPLKAWKGVRATALESTRGSRPSPSFLR